MQRSHRAALLSCASGLVLLALGCGSRSALPGFEGEDGPPRDQPNIPNPPDAPEEPGGPAPGEPGPDEPEPPIPCRQGVCPDDGNVCNGVERCDAATNTCIRVRPLSCDDGLPCNGVEVCDRELGCVPGDPVACGAKRASCDEHTGECVCEPGYLFEDCSVRTTLFTEFEGVRRIEDDGAVLWVMTDAAFWAIDYGQTPSEPRDDTWRRFDRLDGHLAGPDFARGPDGKKWFLAHGGGLWALDDLATPLRTDDDVWTAYPGGQSDAAQSVEADARGKLWTSGRQGQTRILDPERGRGAQAWLSLADLGAPPALAEARRAPGLRTKEDMVWIPTATPGLFAYDLDEELFVDHSAAIDLVPSALALAPGQLWIASFDATASLRWGTMTLFSFGRGVDDPSERWITRDSLRTGDSLLAYEAVESSLVFSGWASGTLACDETDNAAEIPGPGGAIQALRSRSRDELWVGTSEGLAWIGHGGACFDDPVDQVSLEPVDNLHGAATDVAQQGRGLWVSTQDGVDFLDTAGTPFETADDRWAHFGSDEIDGLEGLRAVVVGPDGTKYFWSRSALFAFDDGGTPFDESDDRWAKSSSDAPLWVAGTVDDAGVLSVVGEATSAGNAQLIVWDRGTAEFDPGDDVTQTIESNAPGSGRNMTRDASGQIWVATEGNLYHWDQAGTPTEGADDTWTPMLAESARVWKLAAHPTGGIWATVGGGQGGVRYFWDSATPKDTSDDQWVAYPGLGSTMDIGADGRGWFRIAGGVAVLDTAGTPLDSSDDVLRDIYSGQGLHFAIDLYSNGAVDELGNLWVASGELQVFQIIEQ